MLSLPFRRLQGSAQSTPHNICPKQQLIELESIMRWEREYLRLLEKAKEAKDFRAFSSSSSAKPPQRYLSWASQVELCDNCVALVILTTNLSQYRSAIGM
jgi:hypothetical protein